MADEFNVFPGGTETKDEPPKTQERVDTPLDTKPTPPATVNGRPEHVPEKFWRASKDDPTKGEVNTEAWGKAWGDAEKYARQLEARIRNGSASLGKAPANLGEYTDGFDMAALAKMAPRAQIEAGSDNPSVTAFFQAAHAAGMGVEQARKMLGGYMAALNPHLPESVDDNTAHSQAIAGLGPAGPTMAAELKAWMASQNTSQPYTEAEQAELKRMALSAGGLSLLYRSMRQQRGEGAPPSLVPDVAKDAWTDEGLDEAIRSTKYRNDSDYQERVNKAIRAKRGRNDYGSSFQTTF